MYLNIKSYICKDKVVEHPVIGEVSCSGFYGAFKKCIEITDVYSQNLKCRTLHDISKYIIQVWNAIKVRTIKNS